MTEQTTKTWAPKLWYFGVVGGVTVAVIGGLVYTNSKTKEVAENVSVLTTQVADFERQKTRLEVETKQNDELVENLSTEDGLKEAVAVVTDRLNMARTAANRYVDYLVEVRDAVEANDPENERKVRAKISTIVQNSNPKIEYLLRDDAWNATVYEIIPSVDDELENITVGVETGDGKTVATVVFNYSEVDDMLVFTRYTPTLELTNLVNYSKLTDPSQFEASGDPLNNGFVDPVEQAARERAAELKAMTPAERDEYFGQTHWSSDISEKDKEAIMNGDAWYRPATKKVEYFEQEDDTDE